MKTVNLTGYVLDEEGNIYVRHKIHSVILSEFYNISQQTICDIKKGRRWADV